MAIEMIPVEAPAAPPARPRVLLFGTAFAAAACVMAFAGLIGVYLSRVRPPCTAARRGSRTRVPSR